MNWIKTSAAAFGVFITVIAASASAHATVIVENERTSFNQGRPLLDASGGAASTTFSTGVAADREISGAVQIDVTDIQYWWSRTAGQSIRDAQTDAANAWTFTLSHAGTTANLGGLPGLVSDHWFKTSAFDGVTASGDWILSATSDYFNDAKRMIEFNLGGFFETIVSQTDNGAGGNGGTGGAGGGGQVPVPAPLLLILAGLAGMASARRKA